MTSKILSIIEKEEKYSKELKDWVLKHSGEKHISLGQDGAVIEFSKFWVKLEDKLTTMPEKHRIQVEEAIKSWIEFQIEKRCV